MNTVDCQKSFQKNFRSSTFVFFIEHMLLLHILYIICILYHHMVYQSGIHGRTLSTRSGRPPPSAIQNFPRSVIKIRPWCGSSYLVHRQPLIRNNHGPSSKFVQELTGPPTVYIRPTLIEYHGPWFMVHRQKSVHSSTLKRLSWSSVRVHSADGRFIVHGKIRSRWRAHLKIIILVHRSNPSMRITAWA